MTLFIFSILASSEGIIGIDNPLPNMLYHGEVFLEVKEEPIGKLRAKLGAGIWNGIFLSLSYGGRNIVGFGDIEWEKQPTIDFRIRLFKNEILESVIGFNNEPIENYAEKYIFITLGTHLFPMLLLSCGTNYNYEKEKKNLDLFGNLALSLGEVNFLHLEYIMGTNDQEKHRVGLGYRIHSGSIGIQFSLKNLFSNEIGRQLQIFYKESF
ncbi:MAG: hypothetical protein ABIN61_02920 [candidate division WOR-3 bacterium]